MFFCTHYSLFLPRVSTVAIVRVNLEKEKYGNMTNIVSTEFDEMDTYDDERYSWYCPHCGKDPCLFLRILSNLYDHDDKYLAGIMARHENIDDVMRARRFLAYKLASLLIRGEMGFKNRERHLECVEVGIRDMFPPHNGTVTGYKEASD